MHARAISIIAGLLLAACQPATPIAAEPDVPADYSNAPEWVKRNPLDQKPQAPPEPVSPPSSLPIVIAKAQDLPEVQVGQLNVDGWNQIRIGMSLDELNAAMGTHVSVDKDADYAEYNCTYLDFPDTSWPDIMYISGRVARLEVGKPGLATYGGLEVGDTVAEARAVFGAGLNEQPRAYTGLPSLFLTVWTKGGPLSEWDVSSEAAIQARGIRFVTDDHGTITDIYAGDRSIELIEGCV